MSLPRSNSSSFYRYYFVISLTTTLNTSTSFMQLFPPPRPDIRTSIDPSPRLHDVAFSKAHERPWTPRQKGKIFVHASTQETLPAVWFVIRQIHLVTLSGGRHKISMPAASAAHSFHWFVDSGRTDMHPGVHSHHRRTLRHRLPSLLHRRLALIITVAAGRVRQLIEHADVTPRQGRLRVEQ